MQWLALCVRNAFDVGRIVLEEVAVDFLDGLEGNPFGSRFEFRRDMRSGCGKSDFDLPTGRDAESLGKHDDIFPVDHLVGIANRLLVHETNPPTGVLHPEQDGPVRSKIDRPDPDSW